MKAEEFLSIYTQDGLVQTLAERIRTATPGSLHLKGVSSSLDAVIAAAVFKICPLSHLIVLNDKEEAAYFLSDLKNLLTESDVLFFPLSYKNPYDTDEIENTNTYMRSESLSILNKREGKHITVTYPEALAEKVVNKGSLLTNTFSIEKGVSLDSTKLIDFFYKHDFNEVDFVQKAGQFAIRGGIIDVFAFASESPYRIERIGDHVESIRSFDIDTQLSVAPYEGVDLVPNLQNHLMREKRQSLLDFISPNTRIWIKDIELLSGILDKSMKNAVLEFTNLMNKADNTETVLPPEQLFDTASVFMKKLEAFVKIEFGYRFHLPAAKTITMQSSPQMSFNKNFKMLADNLADASQHGYINVVAANGSKQLERLQHLLENIDSAVTFKPLSFSLRAGFTDILTKINCYTDHQLFEQFYQGKSRATRSRSMTLNGLQKLQPGDFVTHIDYGIGKFAGMEKREVNGRQQEVIRIIFRDDDILYASIHALHKITKYVGKEGTPPPISKLGTGEWENRKARVKRRAKAIAKELIELYAKRKQTSGYGFAPDGSMQAELEASFIYVDTPDQSAATREVKKDMEAPHPMDRLVCGDVGLGKTEVAIRAAFKGVNEGRQVAVLVPTTILALQHYRTFCARMHNFPITIKYISRFTTTGEANEIIRGVGNGTIDIIISTHLLANKRVKFKDLGLLIIDEEQKFGVRVKEKLKELQVNVDVLTLTATPIPRTLHFSLMGARDLSLITTPPANRQAVKTELHTYNEHIIRDVINTELSRNGQVFFVHNRVQNIEQIANIILRLVPDARIGIAHGQMNGTHLEKSMMHFINGSYDVLVSTNIIESGLDIPNANTVIINQAQNFGLSDLHQIRGRVGRSNRKAFCYLLIPSMDTLSSDARKRLATLEEFSELGDGLKVAMRDLEIRGAGNILGTEQSGFINDLGFDAYHNILNDAILELKQDDFKELFMNEMGATVQSRAKECTIETDMEIFIPETYVKSSSERLQLYTDLNRAKEPHTLVVFCNKLKDRFGPIPPPVIRLIDSVRLKWAGETIGAEKITLKSDQLRVYFVPDKNNRLQTELFEHIVDFVAKYPSRCRLKEIKEKYRVEIRSIQTIDKALAFLDDMIKRCKT